MWLSSSGGWGCGLHQCSLRMLGLDSLCAAVYYKADIILGERMESALCTSREQHLPVLTVKYMSWCSAHFAFLKLLIVQHTRVNSSDDCGVRVLLFWVCEGKCIHECVCMCPCFPTVSSRHFNFFPFKAMLSDWNLVHWSVMCFVLRRRVWTSQEYSIWNMCTQAYGSSGEHTTIFIILSFRCYSFRTNKVYF